MENFRIRRLAAFAAVAALSLAACEGDSTGSGGSDADEVLLVVNSVDNTLQVVPADGVGASETISLGAQGTPVDAAARDGYAVVPLGLYPFAAVVDLASDSVTTVALPAGSGATGVAFVNDTLAVVGNPERNSVSAIRVRRGVRGAEISVGVYPQAIVEHDGSLFVINANLVNFSPAGPGSVTVLNSRLQPVKTITLSGTNPASGAVLDGKLYVLNSGSYATPSASLSVIDLSSLTEEAHYTGFGATPASIAANEDDGQLYVSGYFYGISVWNPRTRAFTRTPANSWKPGGDPSIADVGFDGQGQLFGIKPGNCASPGALLQISLATGEATRSVTTGTCPTSVTYARIDRD